MLIIAQIFASIVTFLVPVGLWIIIFNSIMQNPFLTTHPMFKNGYQSGPSIVLAILCLATWGIVLYLIWT